MHWFRCRASKNGRSMRRPAAPPLMTKLKADKNAHGLACQHLDVHAQTTMPQTLCQLNDHFVGSRSHSSGPFRRCPFAHDRGQGSTWCHTALSGRRAAQAQLQHRALSSVQHNTRYSQESDDSPLSVRSPPRNRKTRHLHRHLAQTLGQILLLGSPNIGGGQRIQESLQRCRLRQSWRWHRPCGTGVFCTYRLFCDRKQ